MMTAAIADVMTGMTAGGIGAGAGAGAAHPLLGPGMAALAGLDVADLGIARRSLADMGARQTVAGMTVVVVAAVTPAVTAMLAETSLQLAAAPASHLLDMLTQVPRASDAIARMVLAGMTAAIVSKQSASLLPLRLLPQSSPSK